jgi:hypothetical protein
MNKSHDRIIAKIHALDLNPIKFKLMDAEEGHGWSREYADHVEIEYKRFLTLLVKYPEASIAPSKEIDKFWHGHILDTLKYAEDCNEVFGYFLHHFPYFGMRGKEDAANLAAAANTMNLLYHQEFGSAEPAKANSYCGAAVAASYCGAAIGKDEQAAMKQSSYCGAAVATSYCGAAIGKDVQVTVKQSSYCGATVATSYCGAAIGKDEQAAMKQSSYCGATGATSYCGAGNGDSRNGMSRESVLNTAWRPTLPPSSVISK